MKKEDVKEYKNPIPEKHRFRSKLVEIGTILAIFEPFEICCSENDDMVIWSYDHMII